MTPDLNPVLRGVSGAPAGFRLIAGSLAVAFLWNALPWSGYGLLARPDALLVTLLFWALHEPQKVGLGSAFVLGLLMDVAGSTELGEHALSYVTAAYVAQALRVRVLKFRLIEQAAHIIAIVLVERTVAAAVNLVTHGTLPSVATLAPVLTAALLWPVISWLLFHRLLRRRRRSFG